MATKYLIMGMSLTLGIYCSVATKDWWNTYNLNASWTDTDKWMITSLMGLATCSSVVFILYVRCDTSYLHRGFAL